MRLEIKTLTADTLVGMIQVERYTPQVKLADGSYRLARKEYRDMSDICRELQHVLQEQGSTVHSINDHTLMFHYGYAVALFEDGRRDFASDDTRLTYEIEKYGFKMVLRETD